MLTSSRNVASSWACAPKRACVARPAGRRQVKANAMMGGMAPGAGLSPEVRSSIDKLVNSNKVCELLQELQSHRHNDFCPVLQSIEERALLDFVLLVWLVA
ncbi:hypothetical protein DUNSADRAFT_10739 [Dunaliella salina]|uniref:Uncharacterized protein n=1 Tax=Dunaliella salina TaxID=3046 RepID=A0ABQ7GEP3_DUNSA|nr:hypothetical protein DUNSADRAFT_10739 [Dunaliella salina]|eukprot:KAF5833075.1 hypothetical protein DUNSADRAFT_10739 [Dunaliella salina]